MKINHEKFVVEWQKANSVKQVAEAMGMSYAKAANTAWRLREKGVALKLFQPGGWQSDRQRVDWEKLKSLAASHEPEQLTLPLDTHTQV
jgi:mannose/cellobiose epimerase-like protein (N-acyl-D-glucosamine 2-epimerase family)